MKSRYILPILLFTVLPSILFAQGGATGFAVLKLGSGARTIGMGDAGVASSEDAPSMHYNPAIIGSAKASGLTIMHGNLTESSSEYLGAYAIMNGYTLGFHVMYFGIDGIEVRTTPGEAEGETEMQYISTGLTFATLVTEQLEVGITGKILFEHIYRDDAAGYAFDFGVRYQPLTGGSFENLRLGLAVANVGSMSQLHVEETTLPLLVRYGASHSVGIASPNSVLTVEAGAVTNTEASITHATVGVEWAYDEMAYVRAGYQSGYDNKDLSFGVGVAFSILKCDFAYLPSKNGFGDLSAISITVAL